MQRTSNQNKQLWALIYRLQLDKDMVKELVYQYSQGRTESTSEMIIPECQAMINELSRKVAQAPVSPDFQKANKMRRKIISICHEMGWNLPDGKIDMKRLNSFCENRTHEHKKLNEYTINELPNLVTQFEQILKAHYAKR